MVAVRNIAVAAAVCMLSMLATPSTALQYTLPDIHSCNGVVVSFTTWYGGFSMLVAVKPGLNISYPANTNMYFYMPTSVYLDLFIGVVVDKNGWDDGTGVWTVRMSNAVKAAGSGAPTTLWSARGAGLQPQQVRIRCKAADVVVPGDIYPSQQIFESPNGCETCYAIQPMFYTKNNCPSVAAKMELATSDDGKPFFKAYVYNSVAMTKIPAGFAFNFRFDPACHTTIIDSVWGGTLATTGNGTDGAGIWTVFNNDDVGNDGTAAGAGVVFGVSGHGAIPSKIYVGCGELPNPTNCPPVTAAPGPAGAPSSGLIFASDPGSVASVNSSSGVVSAGLSGGSAGSGVASSPAQPQSTGSQITIVAPSPSASEAPAGSGAAIGGRSVVNTVSNSTANSAPGGLLSSGPATSAASQPMHVSMVAMVVAVLCVAAIIAV